jgi:hypothetical protein
MKLAKVLALLGFLVMLATLTYDSVAGDFSFERDSPQLSLGEVIAILS